MLLSGVISLLQRRHRPTMMPVCRMCHIRASRNAAASSVTARYIAEHRGRLDLPGPCHRRREFELAGDFGRMQGGGRRASACRAGYLLSRSVREFGDQLEEPQRLGSGVIYPASHRSAMIEPAPRTNTMVQIVAATFKDGVFKPDHRPALSDPAAPSPRAVSPLPTGNCRHSPW